MVRTNPSEIHRCDFLARALHNLPSKRGPAMHTSSESLRPIDRSALHPALLTLDNTTSDAPAAPSVAPLTSGVAHDPVAQAARQRIACRSFYVSGAQVDVQRVLFGIVPWLKAERCDVENVSKGGVTFECRYAMTRGESVEVVLRVPGEREPLTLKGEVRWSKRARYGGHRIGIQFAPFGRHGRNPRSVLDAPARSNPSTRDSAFAVVGWKHRGNRNVRSSHRTVRAP